MNTFLQSCFPAIASLGLLAGMALPSSAPGEETAPFPSETKAEHDARMAWWREARFGMFIHWGIYSVPARGEWYMLQGRVPIPQYEKYAADFTASKFDARQWARLAKQAGMKYVVLTSKHHDGFCMWDTKLTDYNIMSTPANRDVVKELAEACREEGITFGLYHSIMDWHHPLAQGSVWEAFTSDKKMTQKEVEAAPVPRWAEYRAHMKGQLKELLTNYGPLGVLWFDGEWIKAWTAEQGRDLYAYCRSLQPSIIINNRVTVSRKGMSGFTEGPNFAGDFATPEQYIPGNGVEAFDWESCMTINNSWGFNQGDSRWKTPQTLVRNLVDIASKGGNYLLNVGPTREGEIPQPSIEALKEIGKWLEANGESIYGTAASPFPKAPDWGRITRKGEVLYLHVFQWPEDQKLTVPGIAAGQAESAWLLADAAKSPLALNASGNTLTIHLAGEARDGTDTVIVLKTKEGALPKRL